MLLSNSRNTQASITRVAAQLAATRHHLRKRQTEHP